MSILSRVSLFRRVSTVYGVNEMHDTPYRTKIQLTEKWRLHKFHRHDEDRAWHDHPNNFWTFPFADYREEVFDPQTGDFHINIVKAWRWHYRPAHYTHRLLGRADGTQRPHWTLVKEDLPEFRMWGFWSHVGAADASSGGFLTWIPWRSYIYGEPSSEVYDR